MARWTIRRWMLLIAGVGVLFGVGDWLERSYEAGCHYGCGRDTQCMSNQRNVVLGILGYVNTTNAFPTGTWPNAGLRPRERLSWYAAISPYLDQQDLYNKIDKTAPWYSPVNAPIAGTDIWVARCPNVPAAWLNGLSPAVHIGIAGLGVDAPTLPQGHPRAGVFGYDRQTRLSDIKDGASCTMVLAESERVLGPWLAGGAATVRGLDPGDPPYLGPGRQFGGLHDGHATNVAFADGSVRVVRDSIDPRVFEALSTIAGRESLPGW